MMNSALTEQQRIDRLAPPSGRITMVLDTDTYNEVDDQFALAYAILSPHRISLEAVYAAPFLNNRSTSPADGMERSYEEILRVLEKLGVASPPPVHRGSTDYLVDEQTPRESDAARDLVARARAATEPLYVVAIGAITNVASAILMDPSIVAKIVVVWLGGNSLSWKDTLEFNLKQDIPAARVVFGSGVPMVQIPCMGVTTHLATTIPELEYYLRGKSAIGDYLVDIVAGYTNEPFGWSKVIWDVAAVAWLIDPSWVPTNLVHSPIVTAEGTWSFDDSRHLIRSAVHVRRDPIFADLFRKLAGA
jgi:purine nucleosidase